MALFAFLIIRLFQLVFSAEIVFFSHNKSAGIVFQLIFSAKQTGPGPKQNTGTIIAATPMTKMPLKAGMGWAIGQNAGLLRIHHQNIFLNDFTVYSSSIPNK